MSKTHEYNLITRTRSSDGSVFKFSPTMIIKREGMSEWNCTSLDCTCIMTMDCPSRTSSTLFGPKRVATITVFFTNGTKMEHYGSSRTFKGGEKETNKSHLRCRLKIQRINPQAVLNHKLGLIPLRTTHSRVVSSPPPPTTCKKIQTLKHVSTPGQKLGLSFTYCTNKSKYTRF